MPKSKSAADYYRQCFEKAYGKKIRHDQWAKYRKEILAAGIALNAESVRFYARFKQIRPRKVLTKSAIDTYLKFDSQYRFTDTFFGYEIREAVNQLVPNLKKDTFYKCFARLHIPFKHDLKYSYEEVCRVVIFAVLVDC